MLDQSPDSVLIQNLFKIENRKGNLNKDFFPNGYLDDKKQLKIELKELIELKKEQELNNVKVKQIQSGNDDVESYKLEIRFAKNEDKIKKNEQKIAEHCKLIADVIGGKSIFSKLQIKINHKIRKQTYKSDNIYSYFSFKLIRDVLIKVFRCYPSDKNLILKDLKLLLNDNTPKWVIRTDISSFYESIPQQELLDRICEKDLLLPHIVKMIKTTFVKYNELSENIKPFSGIPRGICFSAVLSEIYMKDVDKRMRNMSGVYYYARYVDDIIILMKPDENNLENAINRIRTLFNKYNLNLKDISSDKMKFFELCKERKFVKCEFNYLGYLISIEQNDKNVITKYLFSDHKLKRYKDRIDFILKEYSKNSRYKGSLKLLYDELKYLTKNFYLTGSKCNIKTGIYFNNFLLDDIDRLKELDDHLKKRLSDKEYYCPDRKLFNYKKGNEYEDACLGIKNSIVNSFSFEKGFAEKKFCSFTPNRIKILKKILSHAEESEN